jgi:hypothetical protein
VGDGGVVLLNQERGTECHDKHICEVEDDTVTVIVTPKATLSISLSEKTTVNCLTGNQTWVPLVNAILRCNFTQLRTEFLKKFSHASSLSFSSFKQVKFEGISELESKSFLFF